MSHIEPAADGHVLEIRVDRQAIARLQAVSAKIKDCKRAAEQLPGVTARDLVCQHIRAVLLALNRLRCHLLPAPPGTAANCGF